MEDNTKTFVIINSYFIGDILLTNSLVQNIKRLYPDSKVVSLTSPELVDVAKYQEGVDDVVIWDRHGKDRGFWQTLSFAKNFPYKNIYATFPIYGLDRPIILAWLLGSKYILHQSRKMRLISTLKKTKYPLVSENQNIQEDFASLLKGVTDKRIEDVPIRYNVPEISSEIVDNLPEDYTALSVTTSRKSKNIPIEVACELIEKLFSKKIVLLGKGEIAREYSKVFTQKKYSNLIDLTNKTSILEIAQIIKGAQSMISADTGALHFACALQTPVVAVFYEDYTKMFRPNPKLYNCKVICENQTCENILNAYNGLNGDRIERVSD
jgi:ADP-heptose:LPS heptosyltransferase